jgi:hypothetical protein
MRLRRAVPKIPAKSSVPPRLLLHKNRSVKTPSESTLPQLLIPLHFKSRISNTYKNPRGEGPLSGPKVVQLVTPRSPLLRTRRNPCNSNPFYRLFTIPCTPPGGGAVAPVFSAPPPRTLRLCVILVPSRLSTFNCRLSTSRPHLYRRRNTAKMNHSSRPHGHTV